MNTLFKLTRLLNLSKYHLFLAVVVMLQSGFSFAENSPLAYRNTNHYLLSGYALLVVSTNPAQSYQPVYSWRTHIRVDGSGSYSYNGDLIGYTNGQGIFIISANLPNSDTSLCGYYANETFSVGSQDNPRSNALGFSISYDPAQIYFGPLDPSCQQLQ